MIFPSILTKGNSRYPNPISGGKYPPSVRHPPCSYLYMNCVGFLPTTKICLPEILRPQSRGFRKIFGADDAARIILARRTIRKEPQIHGFGADSDICCYPGMAGNPPARTGFGYLLSSYGYYTAFSGVLQGAGATSSSRSQKRNASAPIRRSAPCGARRTQRSDGQL